MAKKMLERDYEFLNVLPGTIRPLVEMVVPEIESLIKACGDGHPYAVAALRVELKEVETRIGKLQAERARLEAKYGVEEVGLILKEVDKYFL